MSLVEVLVIVQKKLELVFHTSWVTSAKILNLCVPLSPSIKCTSKVQASKMSAILTVIEVMGGPCQSKNVLHEKRKAPKAADTGKKFSKLLSNGLI